MDEANTIKSSISPFLVVYTTWYYIGYILQTLEVAGVEHGKALADSSMEHRNKLGG